MKNSVHTLQVASDWHLIKLIGEIERFDASWAFIEIKEEPRIKQLENLAVIINIGASIRIEGSQMTDKEVEMLLENIDISTLDDRDSQEVVGYFNTLDIISESYADIQINTSNIKNLHNILLKYSERDSWHKGSYKKLCNAVEVKFPDGKKKIICETTKVGFYTDEAMNALLEWYEKDTTTHPLVKTALFVYEFVSIHPFHDGNGLLSRLLTVLLFLKNGYKWIQYVRLDAEIENKKEEYNQVLKRCQANRPNENITDWVQFFLELVIKTQQDLMINISLKENDVCNKA